MKKFSLWILIAAMAILLVSCGKAESDKQQSDMSITVSNTKGENSDMKAYDFSIFSNVEITGADLSAMNEEQLSVLYQQARYCQAMIDADIDTMREIVSENMTFTHMSGKQQTRDEYFADVKDGSLRYFTIGIEDPVIEVNGNTASVTFTSVLNANAYGAKGTYRMSGGHYYEMRNGSWTAVNHPNR